MFGSAAANPFASAAGGGGFGAPTPVAGQNASAPFSFTPSTAAPFSGAGGGGLFGGAGATSAPFGAAAAPPSSGAVGLFGAPATPAVSAPVGLFGAPAAGTSLFGAPQAAASTGAPLGGGGLFGPAAPAPAGGGLFGAPAGGGLFGAPASGGLFGALAQQPQQQQQQQAGALAFATAPQPVQPAAPLVSLETPYASLPAEHKQFVEQLDQLIERTADFHRGLLATHGANADGELDSIGIVAADLSARAAHVDSELERDRARVGRCKDESDELVNDARHAHEAFKRRADFVGGAADMYGKPFALDFLARRASAQHRQAEELGAALHKIETLLAVSERQHASAADFAVTPNGAGVSVGGVTDVTRLIREHQFVIEAMAAHVSCAHEHVESLRREYERKTGLNPFREADVAEAHITHKHRHAGVPRAHLSQWSSNQAAHQPSTSGAQQSQQAPTAVPSLFGAPAGGAQLATSAAPTSSLFGAPAQPATSAAPPLGGLGGYGGFGAPAPQAATSSSLFGGTPVAPAASALGGSGGLFGGAGAVPITAQTSFGATQFGAAALQQPNVRPKKKTTARR